MISIETFDINDKSCKNLSIEFDKLLEFLKKIKHILQSAKFHVINVLNKKTSELKKKLKRHSKDQEECGKLKHKEEEVLFLKKADLDSLAKRVFANKLTIKDLDKLGDKLSLEERIIIRLFSFNQLNKVIMDFRAEHSDWEELVDAILYKNTCGKIKINKSNKNKEKVSIPLPNGVKESLTTEKDSKFVFDTPKLENEKPAAIEAEKRKKKEKLEKKEKKLAEEKKKIEETKPVEKFEISEEKLFEFVKNADDLDEWEKEIAGDEDDEFNLMEPIKKVDTVKPKNKTNKEGANFNKKIPVKRKASFPKDSKPKIWKKSE